MLATCHLMLCEHVSLCSQECFSTGGFTAEVLQIKPSWKSSAACFCSLLASSAPEQVSEGSHAKGEKRKSMEEEEKNGREELVEKKVCKGFQTV